MEEGKTLGRERGTSNQEEVSEEKAHGEEGWGVNCLKCSITCKL